MSSKSPALFIEPRLRFSYGRQLAFGPGKADLLEQIDRTGSISEAARAMGMAYTRAWSLVKSLERGFTEPLVKKNRGGNTRGGATLSATGQRVLQLYREMEAASMRATRDAGEQLRELQK